VNFKTISGMVKVGLFGLMVVCMRVAGTKVNKVVLVSTAVVMVKNVRVCGKMVNAKSG
jgi:hypothetical protein